MTAVNTAGAAEAPRASEAGRYDAFISYAREDSDFVVDRLREALRERGQQVWLDLDITGGAKWRERVMRAVEACKALIFVISRASVASEACGQELDDAVALNKLVIPVVYRDNYDGSLPSALADAEWVFLRDCDDFSAGMDRLLEALETDLQWRDQHTRLAGRAREWVDSGGNASYLLRGADLRGAEAWLTQQEGHREAPTREHREYIARSRQAAGRRLYTLIGALSVGLMIATGLAIFALIKENQAVHQTNITRSQLLASEADYDLSTLNAEQGIRRPSILSLGAYAIQPTPQALSAMLNVAGTRENGPPMGAVDTINGLAYAPNKPVVATASGTGVELWGTSFRGQPFDFNKSQIADYALYSKRGTSGVAGTSVAFSPDGRLIAVAAADGTVQVFDANQLLSNHLRSIIVLRAARARATSVAWNAQGSTLAAGDANGNVHIWSLKTILSLGATARPTGALAAFGGPGAVINAHIGSVTTLAFAGHANTLAVGGKDGISLLDAHAPRLIGFLGAHGTSITAIAFAPDGQTLASGGADGKIRLWDVRRDQNIRTLPAIRASVASLAFVDDSSLVSGGSDATIRTWDIAAGYQTASVRASAAVVALAVAPDRSTVAVATSDLQIDFWTSSDRRQVGSLRNLYEPLALATFSADGSTLAVLDRTGRIEAWRDDGHKLVGIITPPAARINALAVSRDGHMIAAGGQDGTIWLWKLPGGALVKEIRAAGTAITAVAISPDGTLLAGAFETTSAGGFDIKVQLWRLPGGVREGTPLSGVVEPVTSMAFSPDGNTLAIVGDKVALWHLPSRREFARPLPIPIVGSTGSGAVRGTVVFSPTNPDLLAVAGAGVQLWDTQDQHPLSPLLTGEAPLAFSRDGAEIAAATASGVQLWDVSTATTLGPAFPTGAAPNAVGFDRAGKLLTTVAPGAVTLWDFNASFLHPLLCALAQPMPSQSEWNELAPGIPFENICHA
jgi:WD40 repeat protein